MSSYNGIPLTTQSAKSQTFYLATDYHIDDNDSAYVQQNSTLNDCMSLCAQNDGVYFLCTAFSFHSNTCYFLDRPINTYTMGKNATNYFGFILARNQNCNNNGGITCLDLPNVSGQSKPAATSNYQSLDWTVSNGWYTSNCKGSTNPIQVYTGTISDNECKDNCNTYSTCTAYAYSDTDSTCSLYDLNLNTIRFTKDADSCGFKISRSQNCFDDGKSVTCQGYQNSPGSSASGPNSSNQPSNGSNTGMIIGIVVAVALVAACVVAVLFYRRKKHSPILVEKQVEHIPPPTDAIPVEQVPQNQYFQATLAPASRTDSKSTAVASNATSSPQQSLQNTLPPVMKPNVESELPILQPGTSFSQANVMQPPVIQGSIQPPVMSSFENTHTQPPIMNLSTSSNKNDSQPPVIVFKESGAAQDSTISAQPPILKDH